MSKGNAIDRVLTFYRTASADTVRVTHQLAQEVMEERGIGGKKVKQTVVRKVRKARTAATPAGKDVAIEREAVAHGG